MSKLFKGLLATAMAFSLVTVTHAENETPKVDVSVTSGEVTVTGQVKSDYSIVATIPTSGAVNPTDVDVNVSMTDIASLGLTGTYTQTWENLSADLGSTSVEIGQFVGGLEDYSSTVTGSVEGNAYTYAINGAVNEGLYTITGTPTGANEAWTEVANHVTTSTQADENSHAIIAAGSYIYADGEIVTIDSELKLDNIGSKNEIYQGILAAGTLTTTTKDVDVEVYLAAGTTIATGYSVATLDDAATITVDGIDLRTILNADTNVLSFLRENVDSTSMVIATAVFAIEPLMTETNGDIITVNVDFEDEVVDFAKGKFNVELTSGTATVMADVAEDYTVNVLVNRGAAVDPSSATVTVYMNGVTGLGLAADEERTQTWTLGNILTAGTQNLDTFVNALDEFEEAVLSGAVKTVTTTTTTTTTKNEKGEVIGTEVTTSTSETEAPYTYTFAQAGTDTHYGIIGTQEGAQAAWAELVAHLTASTQNEDSSASIVAGSYLVVDGQTLVIDENVTLDDLTDKSANYQAILDASTLKDEDLGETDAEVEIYLLAGTKLAIGSSVVTLDDNARIVFDGVSIRETLGLEDTDPTVLEWARENIDSTNALISTLVLSFNSVVNNFNNADAILDIIFEVEETIEKEEIKESEEPITPDPKPEDPKDDDLSTETGDNAPVVAYASVMMVAGLALLALVLKRRLDLSK